MKYLFLFFVVVSCAQKPVVIDSKSIRMALLDHLPEFRECFSSHREKLVNPNSTLTLEFQIGSDGKVTESKAIGRDGLPVEVESCVSGVVSRITFAKPASGGSIGVKQPMNFFPKKP
ncbi:MAG: AgmX/PglI C-terminal domain-containing protein [Bdellovibrionota bacterium]